MNDSEFEDKLRALTEKLARPDPTLAWKADILVRARRAREANVARAPRVLLTILAAAWLLIATFRLTTPADPAGTLAAYGSPALTSQGETPLQMLIAFQSKTEILDQP